MGTSPSAFPDPVHDLPLAPGATQTAVLAGGCFWCTEAVFAELAGVHEVTSGYVGDVAAKADYQTVCSGATKHAEAIRIRFDPAVISYGQLLKVFFSVAHDPTQLDRQGNDVGHQYRSAIFCADDAAEGGGGGLRRAARRSARLRPADRHAARAAHGVLRGRGLPPALRRAEPAPAVHRRDRAAEGREAPQALPREAEVRPLTRSALDYPHRHVSGTLRP